MEESTLAVVRALQVGLGTNEVEVLRDCPGWLDLELGDLNAEQFTAFYRALSDMTKERRLSISSSVRISVEVA